MKYIDSEKLIAEIRKRLKSLHGWETKNKTYYRNLGKESAYDVVLSIITSLQQEQLLRKSPISWMEETKKELQHEEELLDMRLEALKRIREKKNQFKQEQPEVDLEKAIEDYYGNIPDDEDKVKAARHFYELGKNARKEK